MCSFCWDCLGWTRTIQGVVKGVKGQAIKNADVRIESSDGRQKFNTVKTDGRAVIFQKVSPPGVYRVTLIVNGVLKAYITNTMLPFQIVDFLPFTTLRFFEIPNLLFISRY